MKVIVIEKDNTRKQLDIKNVYMQCYYKNKNTVFKCNSIVDFDNLKIVKFYCYDCNLKQNVYVSLNNEERSLITLSTNNEMLVYYC